MAITLYRKYRPQTFKEVVGQNHIKTTIQNELETNKVAHAYLFSGPRGLGKTTMARLLAKAINCLNRKDGQSEPCNTCNSCLEIKDSRSLDVVEIDAASHTGVDNVRENIIANSRFTPTSRKFKVFIIDEVHMLSISAFNALLKTLEEPPSHAMFILATTEIHKVPQTIISRCQRFDFRKVSNKDLLQRLSHIVEQENKKVDDIVLENIVRHAEGCIRDAESLLGQILSLSDKKITAEQSELVIPASHFDLVLQLIEHLIKSNASESITLINRLVQEGVDLQRFTDDLIEVLRKILLIKIGSQLNEFTSGLNKDLEEKISTISKNINLSDLTEMIDIFIKVKQELKSAEINQLPLEIAVIKICSKNREGGNTGTDFTTTSSTRDNQKISKPTVKEGDAEVKIEKPKKQLSKIKLTLEQVKDKWEEVLLCIKKHNYSLASTLRSHQPTAMKTDGTLEVCFKYKFHQQRINDLKNRQTLEKVLQDIFGYPLKVQTIMVKELPDNKTEIQTLAEHNSDQAVNDILKNFGGQLV